MKEILATLVRNLGKILGPLFAAKGWADENSLEAIAGAAATLLAVVWGIIDANKARKAKAAVKAYAAGYPGDFGKMSQTNR